MSVETMGPSFSQARSHEPSALVLDLTVLISRLLLTDRACIAVLTRQYEKTKL